MMVVSPDLAQQFQGQRDQQTSGQPVTQQGSQQPVEQPADGAAPADGMTLVDGRERIAPEIQGDVERILQRHPQLEVASGHRGHTRNRRENGVDRSWHLKGRAVDFKGPIEELYRAAADATRMPDADEVLVHNAGNGMILHVAWPE